MHRCQRIPILGQICWLCFSYLIAILSPGAAASSATDKPDPALTGSYKNLLSATEVRNNYRNLGLTRQDFAIDDIQRLRLKLRYPASSAVDVRLDYELRALWGESARIQSKIRSLPGSGANPVLFLGQPPRQRFLDLETDSMHGSNVLIAHQLDRLNVHLDAGDFDVTIGRQPISWGSGLIWNPTDLFSGFAPTEIDRDDKFGVDVARVTWSVTPSSSVDVVGEPSDDDGPYRVDGHDSAIAVRGSSRFGEYDLSAVTGRIAGDWVVGGDWTGYVGDAGVRGEWMHTWVHEKDQRDYVRALVGVDYAFKAVWDPYLALEYFYNGLGTANADGYLLRLRESSVQRVFARGNAFNMGRNYLGIIARLTPGALVHAQAMTLWNLDDHGVREYVNITWSLADDVDLLVGADVGLGPLGTEFGGFETRTAGTEFRSPNVYFSYLKLYF